MFHFQNPVNDWPRAVAVLPAGYWIKAIDNVQLLNEAKGINPGIKTVLRHHYDTGQQFDGGIEGNKVRARQFFATFIDGTFDNYAHNIDAIEGFNEYLANSQNATEIQQRVDWVTAAADVWKNEYRNQQKYAHIKLVIANTAIGNDIPVAFAKVAVQYDCIVGYHPYVPTKDKSILPGEWPNYAGRWTEMDKRFVAAGYKVQWLFTEGGPVRYYENKGNGFTNGLDPQGGWRMSGCCNADVNAYLAVIKYWLDQKTAWNKANGNRALGEVLFTSGGGSLWEWFETKQPEMDTIANLAKNYVPTEPPPPIDPPPPSPGDGLPRTQYKRNYWTVPQNATEAQWLEICRQAFAEKRTVGFSYDDAGIGALNDKTTVLFGIENQQEFIDWFAEHYPGTVLEFREFPKV